MHRLPWFLRWLAASLAAVAVLTFALVLKGSGQPEPLPSAITSIPTTSSTPDSAISNLLVVLTNDDGAVTGAAVLSRQESGLHVVTINPNVAIDLGDSGVTSLATLVGQPSPGVVQAGVIQATGWRIDATIVMARLAFAGLIDLVGGIDVVSDRELLVGDPARPTAVHAGTSHLQGAPAADYAEYLAPGEPESARIPRFIAVLRAALEGLPVDAAARDDVITALGSLTQTSIAPSEIGNFAAAINAANEWPTANLRNVSTAASDLEQVDGSAWLRIVAQQALGLVPAGESSAGPLRIEVVGGSASQRLLLRESAREHGYGFVDGGSATSVATSTVTMKAAAQPVDMSAVVANLGLSELSPPVAVVPGLACDVVVQVGDDFVQPN